MIFSKLTSKFLNLKIRTKFLACFILAGFLPFLFYIVLSNHLVNRIVIERENLLTQNILEQAISSVENELEDYNKLSNFMFNNTVILDALNIDYDTNYFKMYKTYSDVIEPLFITYSTLYPHLTGITVYSSCDILPYKNYKQNLSVLQEFEWYPLVSGQYIPVWTLDSENNPTILYNTRLIGIPQKYQNTTYLCLKIDFQKMLDPFRNITSDIIAVIIRDQSGNIIFSSLPDMDQNTTVNNIDSASCLLQHQMDSTGWTIQCYNSVSSINKYMISLYGFGCVILLFLIAMILIISISILSPIEFLINKIVEIQSKDISHLSIDLECNREDEIGMLFRSFSQLLEQIQNSIQINLKNEREKKQMQQKLLYAQINPHFLYNSLSMINSQALLQEQHKISDMIILISTFYRTALNHGNDMTTLNNELLNIKSYIQIQLFSYREHIDVVYDIDNSCLDLPFPTFLLQPLVENAFEHGLKHCLHPNKTLTTTIRFTDDKINFSPKTHLMISIQDNGIGMDEETRNSLFKNQSKNYGIKNVNERLQLLYGNNYTMTIISQPNEGTCITLLLPCSCSAEDITS